MANWQEGIASKDIGGRSEHAADHLAEFDTVGIDDGRTLAGDTFVDHGEGFEPASDAGCLDLPQGSRADEVLIVAPRVGQVDSPTESGFIGG